MNCHLAIASNHILGFEASKRNWAILINRKMKSREPTKHDRIRKKIHSNVQGVAIICFQSKRDGGSSAQFSAIGIFPTKSSTLVNGQDDKEEKCSLTVT